MPIEYPMASRSARMADVVAALDGAPGHATLEICDSDYSNVLAVFTLQKPSFSEVGGTLTMLGVPLDATNLLTGNAALARLKDGAGVIWASGMTVGTSGTDIVLSSAELVAGAPLILDSCSIAPRD
jgi:hypothetical protein